MAKIGLPAPALNISKWLQGPGIKIEKEKQSVIFIEVFQVSCIGSFLHGIPKTIELYDKYQKKGLIVIGLATAFGQYDINTLQNLELLLSAGDLQGGPLRILSEQGGLVNGNKLSYKINFPVAMDSIIKLGQEIDDEKIEALAVARVPNYVHFHLDHKVVVREEIRKRCLNKGYFAETVQAYALKGTPSSILIDKKGILRHVIFGYDELLEEKIQKLLAE